VVIEQWQLVRAYHQRDYVPRPKRQAGRVESCDGTDRNDAPHAPHALHAPDASDARDAADETNAPHDADAPDEAHDSDGRVVAAVLRGVGYGRIAVSEPNTDIVKAAAKGAVAGAVGEFIEKLGGFGVETSELIRDHVRFVRAKAQMKMYEKTMAILSARNITPNKVAWKTLFPLLDLSSLEDENDEEMIDRWASLLANAAAGPERGATVLPSFPRILSELSPEEAAILHTLDADPDPARVPSLYHLYPDDPRLDRDDDRLFYVRCFNLARLGLLLAPWENAQIGNTDPMVFEHKVHYLEAMPAARASYSPARRRDHDRQPRTADSIPRRGRSARAPRGGSRTTGIPGREVRIGDRVRRSQMALSQHRVVARPE
jgi:hypothetical protein